MSSVMLASYPEVFAGGAIIAGLPYGTASTVPEAFDRMRGQGGPTGEALVDRVRTASDHRGRWPTISIWHGSADATVNPSNADDIVAQWRGVHGLSSTPSRVEAVEGYPRRVWRDATGRDVIEEYSITGMGHGVPLDAGTPDGLGASGPYMFDVGISSTRHIAEFWNLAGPVRKPLAKPARVLRPSPAEGKRAAPGVRLAHSQSGIGRVINDALRAAGLMR